jgi:DNA-binding transcriptional LysR family regulator
MAAATRPDPNWHGVELRHLIALRAVATERSFSNAARKLGYTQSAVSGQVLRLERLIGARLFVRVRGTRPLELTEEGRILLGHATAMLARLEAAQAELGATRDEPLPRLRVGTFWGVGGALVPAVCRRVGSAFAQIDIQEERSVDSLLNGLERRTLDLVLTTLPTREGPFECLPLLRDPYTVVFPRTRKVGAGATLTLDELAALPVLTLDGCPAQSSLERPSSPSSPTASASGSCRRSPSSCRSLSRRCSSTRAFPRVSSRSHGIATRRSTLSRSVSSMQRSTSRARSSTEGSHCRRRVELLRRSNARTAQRAWRRSRARPRPPSESSPLPTRDHVAP